MCVQDMCTVSCVQVMYTDQCVHITYTISCVQITGTIQWVHCYLHSAVCRNLYIGLCIQDLYTVVFKSCTQSHVYKLNTQLCVHTFSTKTHVKLCTLFNVYKFYANYHVYMFCRNVRTSPVTSTMCTYCVHSSVYTPYSCVHLVWSAELDVRVTSSRLDTSCP